MKSSSDIDITTSVEGSETTIDACVAGEVIWEFDPDYVPVVSKMLR